MGDFSDKTKASSPVVPMITGQVALQGEGTTSSFQSFFNTTTNSRRNFDLYGGSGPVCNACHPIPTQEQIEEQKKLHIIEIVRRSALGLMEKYRDHVAKAYDRDMKNDDAISEVVKVSIAIEKLNDVDRQIEKYQSEFNRLSHGKFEADKDWFDTLVNSSAPLSDNKTLSCTSSMVCDNDEWHYRNAQKLRSELEDPSMHNFINQNGWLYQQISKEYANWRFNQRVELSENIRVLYSMHPLFGITPPNLISRVGTAPARTTIGPAYHINERYKTLLSNIDDVIEKIRSDDIDPLTIPDAVKLAQSRLDEKSVQYLKNLLDEREKNEVLKTAGVTFGMGFLGPFGMLGEGSLFAMANVTADVAGGLMFLSDAEEHFDRLAIAGASGSPDRSLLGVPALSGSDGIQLVVDGILTIVGLVGVATVIKGKPKLNSGSGSAPANSGATTLGNPATRYSAEPNLGSGSVPARPGATRGYSDVATSGFQDYAVRPTNPGATGGNSAVVTRPPAGTRVQVNGKATAVPQDVPPGTPPAWMLEDIKRGGTQPLGAPALRAEMQAPPGAREPNVSSRPKMETAPRTPAESEKTLLAGGREQMGSAPSDASGEMGSDPINASVKKAAEGEGQNFASSGKSSAPIANEVKSSAAEQAGSVAGEMAPESSVVTGDKGSPIAESTAPSKFIPKNQDIEISNLNLQRKKLSKEIEDLKSKIVKTTSKDGIISAEVADKRDKYSNYIAEKMKAIRKIDQEVKKLERIKDLFPALETETAHDVATRWFKQLPDEPLGEYAARVKSSDSAIMEQNIPYEQKNALIDLHDAKLKEIDGRLEALNGAKKDRDAKLVAFEKVKASRKAKSAEYQLAETEHINAQRKVEELDFGKAKTEYPRRDIGGFGEDRVSQLMKSQMGNPEELNSLSQGQWYSRREGKENQLFQARFKTIEEELNLQYDGRKGLDHVLRVRGEEMQADLPKLEKEYLWNIETKTSGAEKSGGYSDAQRQTKAYFIDRLMMANVNGIDDASKVRKIIESDEFGGVFFAKSEIKNVTATSAGKLDLKRASEAGGLAKRGGSVDYLSPEECRKMVIEWLKDNSPNRIVFKTKHGL